MASQELSVCVCECVYVCILELVVLHTQIYCWLWSQVSLVVYWVYQSYAASWVSLPMGSLLL